MDVDTFPLLIRALYRPSVYPHPVERVEHIETHISHVFLAGRFAYKLKKPVDLGFLDFSTLERRRHCCEEELRLNRRLSPDLYLDLVAITGTPHAPRFGGPGEVLEYAVRMRRFPQESLLTQQVLSGPLIDTLAEQVADFHARIPIAAPETRFGTPEAILAPIIESLAQIRGRGGCPEPCERLDRLETWVHERWRLLTPVFERRRLGGHVRECHGDMHRGNIALVDGEIRIFDAIEFAPALRWIDTASEIAFLVMDLEEAGETALARRFLNRYLERGGDYELLEVLDLYKVYRALVRAKVAAIRLGQPGLSPEERARERDHCTRYLVLADADTEARAPSLIMICGLSGSGKSHLARQLREHIPLIHLRSDIERKRLFGIPEVATTRASLDDGIYFPAATEWTYARLLRLSESILSAGYAVMVDATFIAQARRARFWSLAERLRVPVAILALDAPLEVLRDRIRRRCLAMEDASDADLCVLDRQRAAFQTLQPEERARAVTIDTSDTPPMAMLIARLEGVLRGTLA